MKIAITGHRPHKLWNDYDLKSPQIAALEIVITNILLKLYENYPLSGIHGISGMAIGIDTLFVKSLIKLNFSYTAAVPCKGQDSKWPQKSRDLYRELLSKAKEVVIVSDRPYFHGCMQIRNEWMVDNSDLLIGVWDGSDGGTANCIKYAEFIGQERIIINPKTLEVRNQSYQLI